MKLIIAGSRGFYDFALLCKVCDSLLQNKDKGDIEIISGCATGADLLGERYAGYRGYKIKRFPAQWGVYGKSAGVKRNKLMVEYADHLIAFWDGKSQGTRHTINFATKKGLKMRIIMYENEDVVKRWATFY